MPVYMVFIDIDSPAIPIGMLEGGEHFKVKNEMLPGSCTMILKCQSRGQPPNLQSRQPGMTYLVWTFHQDFTYDQPKFGSKYMVPVPALSLPHQGFRQEPIVQASQPIYIFASFYIS